MSLYEDWIKKAYDQSGQSEKKVWDDFVPKEQKIYEYILGTKTAHIKNTVKELGVQFNISSEYICGFIDGINEALKEQIKVDELTPDTVITMDINFETLYKKMVEYKAEHLSNLPEWKSIFTEEERKQLTIEQRTSKTVVKSKKIGRNDPCPCGSGKKYKMCHGRDADESSAS